MKSIKLDEGGKERLKLFIKKIWYTQKKCGKDLGLSQQTLSSYCRRGIIPNHLLMLFVSRYFLNKDWLFTGLGSMSANPDNAREMIGVDEKNEVLQSKKNILTLSRQLAMELTILNIRKNNLFGETITEDHVKNNRNMRECLLKSGFVPEDLLEELE